MPLGKLIVQTPKKLSDLVSALLFEAGAGGIEELDGGRRLVVYAENEAAAAGIADRARTLLRAAAPGSNGVALRVEVDEKSDWATAWTEHLGQVALTPRLVIQPLRDQARAPAGTQRILFDPKLCFGDGAHATTRLASAATERACRARPGLGVLDVGSGTGVLSFVALLSGAMSAWGVDTDPVSVEAARRNATLNDLAGRAQFGLPSELPACDFELVVANLEAPALLASAREIVRWANAAERLILTGFLGDREAEIRAAFSPEFRVERAEREDDWELLELVPRG